MQTPFALVNPRILNINLPKNLHIFVNFGVNLAKIYAKIYGKC